MTSSSILKLCSSAGKLPSFTSLIYSAKPARITLPADLDKAGVEQAALAAAEVQPFLAGKAVRKVIVVRNIVNIVVA